MRLLAGEIRSVYAKAGRYNPNIKHEDYANIILNFENGKCGVLEINWLTPVKIRRLCLTCSKNLVEADYIDQSVTISSSTFKKIDELNLYHSQIDYNVNRISLEKREPLKNEIEDFINAVKNNKMPFATGKDGLITLKICEAAKESYKKGGEVKIK
jgi:UDP-N-acetylglucosamine 3-dehydrogenase